MSINKQLCVTKILKNILEYYGDMYLLNVKGSFFHEKES